MQFLQVEVHTFAELGDVAALKLVSSEEPQKLNQLDELGRTTLHRAALKGQRLAIEMLLAAGVDVNKVDNDGWTALNSAAANGQNDAVSALVKGSPDVNTADKCGYTPLRWATYWAAATNITTTIETLLAAKADPNIPDDQGVTALSRAADKGHTNSVSILLEGKADPRKPDNEAWCPLNAAVMYISRWIHNLLLFTL